ncbi:MAG: EI24 domain-containing protein, partial [Sphingopyxis sp.]
MNHAPPPPPAMRAAPPSIMRAARLALAQLAHPATLKLVLLVALLTVLVFAGLAVALWQGLVHILVPMLDGWVDAGDAAGIAVVLTGLMGWFLFRAVAVAVMGLFTDSVIATVENAHYPRAAARAVPVPFLRGVGMGMRSAARAVGWNMAALPLYIVLLTTGVGTLALMLVLNAALLSRDFEAMVVARHPDKPAHPLTRRQRWALGLCSSAMFVI